eukprot:199104-Alexandrium_andersonii.AAC.1
MRLTSHDTYWRVCVEGVSCAARVNNFHKRGSDTQVTIPEDDFHITAILIKGFHPNKRDDENESWGGMGPGVRGLEVLVLAQPPCSRVVWHDE